MQGIVFATLNLKKAGAAKQKQRVVGSNAGFGALKSFNALRFLSSSHLRICGQTMQPQGKFFDVIGSGGLQPCNTFFAHVFWRV